jgi:hypothetical protein
MGANGRAKVRSDGVIVAAQGFLTSLDSLYQAVRPTVRSVVVLGVGGSSPLAHPSISAGQATGLSLRTGTAVCSMSDFGSELSALGSPIWTVRFWESEQYVQFICRQRPSSARGTRYLYFGIGRSPRGGVEGMLSPRQRLYWAVETVTPRAPDFRAFRRPVG